MFALETVVLRDLYFLVCTMYSFFSAFNLSVYIFSQQSREFAKLHSDLRELRHSNEHLKQKVNVLVLVVLVIIVS